jgi:hypothetical protein
VAFIARPAGSAVNQKPPPIIIHITNPDAFSGQGSIIVLELADEDAAIKVARQIANETGRGVTVRNADMLLVEAIAATKIHYKNPLKREAASISGLFAKRRPQTTPG